MSYPDEILPAREMGLQGLLTRAKPLLSSDTVDDFVSLLLAGRLNIEDEQHRIFVNPLRELNDVPPASIQCTGDFDSLIGFTHDLHLVKPLSVSPVPNFQHTLKKSIHVSVAVRSSQVFPLSFPFPPLLIPFPQNNVSVLQPHKIPNVCFARFGVRSQINIFFPYFSRESDVLSLSQDDLAYLYNKSILPAVASILPEQRAHWPPSYEAAMRLYRDARGTLHHGTIDIPPESVSAFARRVRRNLKDHPRLQKPFFMVQLRGTKGMFSFPFHDADARRIAFNNLISDLNLVPHSAELDNWYVDIGLELALPDHVLQWTAASHNAILAHVLPSLSPQAISTLHNSSAFQLDLSAHLYDLAGFRLPTGTRGHADQVFYVNCYTTDKSVTYQLHNGIFKPHRPSDLYPGKISKLLADVNAISSTFSECAGLTGSPQDGTARLELRVGLSKALTALSSFPLHLIRLSVVCIPDPIWWSVSPLPLRLARTHPFLPLLPSQGL